MRRAASLSVFLLLLAGSSGCVHHSVSGPGPRAGAAGPAGPGLQIDPLRIVGGEDPLLGLDGYDGDDLFALGYAAFDTRDFALSRAIYERMVAEFPEHRDIAPATWNLALSLEKLGEIEAAIPRFEDYVRVVEPEQPDEAARGRIRLAGLLQRQGHYDASAPVLERAAESEELDRAERWEIRILGAMVLAAQGSFGLAESQLNRIRREIRGASLRENERFPYTSAMLWYEVGLLYRMRAASVALVAVDDLEQLSHELGTKARLLLEARQHFKRCIEHNVASWSGPAALALGGVYEDFRGDLLAAPQPTALRDEARSTYCDLLVERTRQFLEKAAVDYRDVLELAGALRLEEAWVEEVEAALDRCEAALAGDVRAELNPPAEPPPEDG